MVMKKAGVIDLTSFGKIEVTGPDSHRFMDHICANVVPKVGIICLGLPTLMFLIGRPH